MGDFEQANHKLHNSIVTTLIITANK